MRILIVDDSHVALAVLRNALEMAGHEVTACCSGEEAWALQQRDPRSLIITDWVMPEMDGLELCRNIRESEAPGYVYVILLTSDGGTQRTVEGLAAGADDFIVKPFDPDELHVRIRAAERVLSLDTRDMAIFALAKLAESRDPETGAHLERVRDYAKLLARNFLHGVRRPNEVAEYVRLIYLTSPLHDIGKVGIPDSILLKPGRLSEDEFAVMKTHTTIGASTLAATNHRFPGGHLLRMGQDIALNHHERFDGGGYPGGRSGQDIPLCGRIVALADVYDALTSQRVYKAAYPHEVASEMIVEQAARHFDPAVVEIFQACGSQFQAIRERYVDAAHLASAREPAGVGS